MIDFIKHIENITGVDYSIAWKIFCELEKAIEEHTFDKNQFNPLLEKLIIYISEKGEKKYPPLALLRVLAINKFDISRSEEQLELLLKEKTCNDIHQTIVETLDVHYVNIKKEEKLIPKDELVHQHDWTLHRVGRRSYYPDSKQSMDPIHRSHFFACPLCGKKDNISTFTDESVYGTNISGGKNFTEEIRCQHCSVYSIFIASESF